MSQEGLVKVARVIRVSEPSTKDGLITTTVNVSRGKWKLDGVFNLRGEVAAAEGETVPFEACTKLEGQIQNRPVVQASPLDGE